MTSFTLLILVVMLVLTPIASAQHTADQPPPRAGSPGNGRLARSRLPRPQFRRRSPA
ncbi:MAG: hypothetical protein IPF53_23095 [Blastocatellia bacterium]|nr:hypothetical protein [Blastocatellia bacterium]